MNKKYTYYLLLLFFAGATFFILLRYNGKLKNEYVAFYPLKERKGGSALAPEWTSVKSKADQLIRIVRDNPNDIKSTLALASLYIQEARITGAGTYYNAAALKYLDAVLEQQPHNFEALTLKALVNLSQHHFAEGLMLAQQAQKIGPYNAFVYGLLIDGNVEMGNYKEAVEAAEQMISLRPDIRSYSRIGYLREIHGDLDGAIEAMERAVKAGAVGDEPTAWARVQLGRLYEQTGNLPAAEMHYTIALDQRPQYPYALAGLGRIAWAKKEYKKAIPFYLQADTIINDPVFKEELAQLYIEMGDKANAERLLQGIVAEVKAAVAEGKDDENAAHHADDQLATAYLLLGDYKQALHHALNEYNRRPLNIEMNALVAWSYHLQGDDKRALPFAESALKTGCKNPTLLARMGLIFAHAGKNTEARLLLQNALKSRANIGLELQQQATSALNAQ